MAYKFVVQILPIACVNGIARDEFSNELKVLGVELIAIVHEFDILLSDAILDRRWHFHNTEFRVKRQFGDALGERLGFDVEPRVEQHVSVPPSFLPTIIHAFEHVIENFTHVLAAKALRLHFFLLLHLALRHVAVVELVPSDCTIVLSVQDVRVVVATAGLTAVHDDTAQSILGASTFVHLLVVAVDNFALELGEAGYSVRLHIQISRKFEVIVKFNGAHAIVIVFESLQLYRQYRWKFFDAQSLDGYDFFVAFITVIGIGTLEKLALDVLFERVEEIAVIPDVHAYHAEWLFLRISMRAALADLLIAVRTTENFSHYLLVAERLEGFVQTLDETHEEFYSVLLLTEINRFTLQSAEQKKR